MNKSRIPAFVGALAIAAVTTFAPPAFADTINLKATLKGSDEVPPNDSKGTGTVLATYNTANKQFYFVVNYAGLSGPATAAHFHGPAEPGKNAGVVIPVKGSVANPIRGTVTLTDAQAADLMAGKWYFNIHTAANKDGEIRGQVTK